MSTKNDERFADPKTDADPRTSETTRTGMGAYDINADNATVPADVPGVRRGDSDTAAQPSTTASVNTDLSGDVNDADAQSNR